MDVRRFYACKQNNVFLLPKFSLSILMKYFTVPPILLILIVFTAFIQLNPVPEKLPEPSNKVELGKLLFNDPILSKGNQISCASCHKPQYAFADNVPFSFGVDSLKGTRNTPSAMNLDEHYFFFHDGRAESLEQQAQGPIENPVEMNLPISEAVKKLNKHKQYPAFFMKIFHVAPNKENLLKAIAAFERSLSTANSPFDRYSSRLDTSLFSEAAKRGQALFVNKGKCFNCHFGTDFTTDEFRNIGLFNAKDLNDSGRYAVSKELADIGRFKVPGLRNVSVTAPYMHNGMFKTLSEVIDYYNEPDKTIPGAINRDSLLAQPLNLSEKEKKDLEAFLISLTDLSFNKD